jgi:hypothetical protein
MIVTAPAASASIDVCAPFSVKVEQITTGVGRSDMIFFRKVMPSMRGISTSSTITSGHTMRMRSMARIGSATAWMTSIPAALLSRPVSTCRTTAESSTTNTLILLIVAPWVRVAGGARGMAVGGEDVTLSWPVAACGDDGEAAGVRRRRRSCIRRPRTRPAQARET